MYHHRKSELTDGTIELLVDDLAAA